jgi:transcriptional regulator with XRE-family HTH domain
MKTNSKNKITLAGTRIRQWRKTIPLKGYKLAEILKISQGSLSDIENNKSLPSADTIAKFHMNTNINILWLLTGKGAMTKDVASITDSQDIGTHKIDSDLEVLIAKLIRVYNAGDSKKKALIKGFLNGADLEAH